ncbi:TetR/AcrR family transcriptional regulator [Streptomyces sp. SS]|uniref:TetR/AcrR family transcriptional regulator n=1 Tax=Streptomyces sp. SS TaxID=260742 RepID=UPI000FFBA9C2|nr:TetR/AcrR family transcriptional regulator [Streptomyces sp. SS]
MPLLRFDRLPAERQESILTVARRHFADHGTEAASYNKIIEAAGFSKTAAYHYFDGWEDLLAAVLDGVLGRLLGALGPWTAARDEPECRVPSRRWRWRALSSAACSWRQGCGPRTSGTVGRLPSSCWWHWWYWISSVYGPAPRAAAPDGTSWTTCWRPPPPKRASS